MQQIEGIVSAVLKAFKYYNMINHLPERISLDSILFDGRRTVLLDPWLSSVIFNNQKLIYKSP